MYFLIKMNNDKLVLIFWGIHINYQLLYIDLNECVF